MEAENILRGIAPLVGEVIPIRSVQETRPVEDYADAYVAEVNVKTASKVIKALDSAFPRNSSHPLSHLRRFAKHNQIPESLRPTFLKAGYTPSQTIFVLIPSPLPAPEALQTLLAPFVPPPREPAAPQLPTEPSIPCAPAAPTSAEPTTSSSTTTRSSSSSSSNITLHTITVPMQPPLTPQQADLWSSKMWPVVFNPAAPRALIAPPPQTLARVRESIAPKAGHYLALAQVVAAEAERSGLGRGVGAVVVDPELEPEPAQEPAATQAGLDWTGAIVAVAGDGRYSRGEGGKPAPAPTAGPNPKCGTYDADCEGGPELHALMRAVELISSKRREDKPGSRRQQIRPVLYQLEEYFLQKSDAQLDAAETTTEGVMEGGREEEASEDDVAAPPDKYQKTTETEAHAIHLHHHKQSGEGETAEEGSRGAGPRIRSRAQGGYLCNDLDVYLSHEPCICCCMGLLLSRFRAVIFPRRGRMVSGGLASEPVVKPVPVEAEAEAEAGGEAPEATGEAGEPASKQAREYYGLHWRKELNWRALGFEFVAAGDGPNDEGSSAESGVAFHA
ncbi:putative tRNA-specific adenosine-34 deaminase subunit Tad3 [Aspergillus saccharolyticus JOP 1030-1]|uniref:Cytidine deaminase-like protein n=1 Tax=Aspergillus saccharolyticus JOP 1030-1 TaxID=1450539 RepID=A0A319A5E1_9EURO|nr:hypothetical protein BP01DRAFT_425469 [Aspergillus saccharolyticus JOP 1030-1]PYH42632.1 hypothetical protein BP01DRAFT_425469 [Aspergillus saccharolyticus JOP 1030-1]